MRDPALRNVWNLRPSYEAEAEAWIAHLVDRGGMRSIAVLFREDAFGRVGLAGVEKALARRNLAPATRSDCSRNTVEVKSALNEIKSLTPEAVVMVGAYQPIAIFIKQARRTGLDATFVTISFVGAEAPAAALGPDGDGVIISQVTSFPWDT